MPDGFVAGSGSFGVRPLSDAAPVHMSMRKEIVSGIHHDLAGTPIRPLW